ncbi:MAG: sensor histidine kinase [Anaerolineaceae bacterium]
MKESGLGRIPLPFFRWRGFTIRIFLITILPVLVIILAIVFLSQYLHLREMRMMVGDRNLRSVRLAADNIANQLQDKREILLLYEKTTSQNPKYLDIEPYFDRGIAIFDISTNHFQPITSTFPLESVDPDTVRTWQSMPVDTISDPISISIGKESLAIIAVPGPDEKIFVGAFDPQKFLKNSVENLMAAASVSIWIKDPHQILYAATTTAYISENPPNILDNQDSSQFPDGIRILPAKNGDLVISYTPIDGTDWLIIYEETWGSVASPLINTTFYMPLILIPLFVIAVIALWFGARQIVIPLQKLQQQSLQLGRGDFAAIQETVGGIEEIQNLQQQLIQVSQELQLVQGNLHQYIGALTAGVENERQNLARELHDDTLQSLIALQQRVQMSELQQQQKGIENHPDLVELKGLVQKSIQNLRRLVRGLRPAYLDDFGLVSAVKILVEEMRSGQNILIELEVQGQEQRLPETVELAFYRITQEALSNVIRHSNARQAVVLFSFSDPLVVIEIKDDGGGFNIPDQMDAFAPSGHYGLLGMSERADLVGAELVISSIPGKGTSVRVEYRR